MIFFCRIFCFVLFSKILSFVCEAQDVYFGLKDRGGADEVIMIGEKNVTITCNVSCAEEAEIQILFGELVLAHNSYAGNSVDYTINVVVAADHTYRCFVRYIVTEPLQGLIQKLENMTFSPLVLNNNDNIACWRNGTLSKPYKVGDTLLLQCFCRVRVTGPCQWLRLNTNSQPPILPSTSLTSTDGMIHMVQATSGRLGDDDDDTVFVCSSDVAHTSNPASCVIGPMLPSGRETVFSSHQMTSFSRCEQVYDTTTEHLMTSYLSDEKHLSNTVNTSVTTRTINQHRNDVPDKSNQLFIDFEVLILVIIGIVAAIVIILIVVVVWCLIRNFRSKREDKPITVVEEAIQDHDSTKMQDTTITELDHDYDTPPFIAGGTGSTAFEPFSVSSSTDTSLEKKEYGYTFIRKNQP